MRFYFEPITLHVFAPRCQYQGKVIKFPNVNSGWEFLLAVSHHPSCILATKIFFSSKVRASVFVLMSFRTKAMAVISYL